MTAMGSLFVEWLMRSRSGYRRPLLLESCQRLGDREHLPVVERLRQRVGDPVDGPARLPRDEPQPAAVVVELQLAGADRARLVGVVEDRRGLPRPDPGGGVFPRRAPWGPPGGGAPALVP